MPPKGSLVLGSELEIAEHVIEDMTDALGEIVSNGGIVYAWSGTHWSAIAPRRLFSLIKPYDGLEYGFAGNRRVIRLSKQKIEAVEKLIVRILDVPDYFATLATGVPCLNGLIRFDGGKAILEPHHPSHRNRHVMPMEWDGTIVTDPPEGTLLFKYLDGIFQGDEDAADKRLLLAEVMGVALAGSSTQLTAPKAIILHGASAENGKSQFQVMLQALVPQDAQVTLSPALLGDPRNVVHLDGAALVSASEIGGRAIASEALKAAVTGDAMFARPLYKPGHSVHPKALHVYSANQLPGFSSGMDAGVRRRLLIVAFNRVIPHDERIGEIGLRIAEHEYPILFGWAIGGGLRATCQGQFTQLPSSDAALKEWAVVSDPIECWLGDPSATLVTGSDTDRIATKAAFAAFRKWAETEGLRDVDAGTHTMFTQRLRGFAARGLRIRHGNRGNMVHGLALVQRNSAAGGGATR
tara:strand:+ start:2893 stop:4290 length:1398 start_codon:yes stop_codon:yes gene_type:complete